MSEPKYQASKFGQVHEERSDIPLIPEIQEIDKQLAENPAQPELWMERGKILRKKQKLCREAIESHSMGLTYDPFNSLLYRYRGHVCVNVERYKEAAADFELSVRIDPLNWDSWYHLGLAYYLLSDYTRARGAYERCIEITADDDSLVAVLDWYWLTLMHLGEKELAAKAVEKIVPGMNIVDNRAYYNRVLAYNNQRAPEDVVAEARTLEDHMFATQTYGIAYMYELAGEMDKCKSLLEEIVGRGDDFWSGFAEHAARKRLKEGF
jgi:tetratricopeptide (TPR) repeat protein